MEGKTHILTAVATYGALNTYFIQTNTATNSLDFTAKPEVAFIALGALILGSVFPDMDLPNSTVSNKMTLVNLKMAKVIINVFLLIFSSLIIMFSGNKYIMYGGCGVLLVSFLSYGKIARGLLQLLRRIIQIGAIVALIFGFIVKGETPLLLCGLILAAYVFSKHRGLSHTLLLNAVTAYVIAFSFIYYGFYNYSIVAGTFFFLGTFMHVFFNDFLTTKGIPSPLYPIDALISLPFCIAEKGFTMKSLKEAFKIKRIKFIFTIETGGTGEIILSIVCIGIILFTLIKANFLQLF